MRIYTLILIYYIVGNAVTMLTGCGDAAPSNAELSDPAGITTPSAPTLFKTWQIDNQYVFNNTHGDYHLLLSGLTLFSTSLQADFGTLSPPEDSSDALCTFVVVISGTSTSGEINIRRQSIIGTDLGGRCLVLNGNQAALGRDWWYEVSSDGSQLSLVSGGVSYVYK